MLYYRVQADRGTGNNDIFVTLVSEESGYAFTSKSQSFTLAR